MVHITFFYFSYFIFKTKIYISYQIYYKKGTIEFFHLKTKFKFLLGTGLFSKVDESDYVCIKPMKIKNNSRGINKINLRDYVHIKRIGDYNIHKRDYVYVEPINNKSLHEKINSLLNVSSFSEDFNLRIQPPIKLFDGDECLHKSILSPVNSMGFKYHNSVIKIGTGFTRFKQLCFSDKQDLILNISIKQVLIQSPCSQQFTYYLFFRW